MNGVSMEENNSIVTLIDEKGKESDFDLIATFDYEGKRYAALLPMEKVEGVSDDEVLILEIIQEKGGEVYRPIESDILLDEVFNEFLEILDAMADGEYEEE